MTTDQRPDPLDAAFAAIRRSPVPERPSDDALLAQLNSSGTKMPDKPVSPFTRRNLMRVTIWSTAATLLVASCTLFLFTGSAPVALADVIKAAKKHKLVKYKMTQTDETKEGSSVEPLVQTAYADLEAPRSRIVAWTPGHLSGAIDFESVYVRDATRNVLMHVITETITEKGKTDPKLIEILKVFEKIGVPRKTATLNVAYGDFTPATEKQDKSILDNLSAFEKHKDAVARKSKLSGKDVLKYRIEEEHKTTTLWVDSKTKLPVRVESELTDPKILHPTVNKMKFVMSDFEWDPKVKGFDKIDELFSTTPPKGYKVEDLRKKADKKSK